MQATVIGEGECALIGGVMIDKTTAWNDQQVEHESHSMLVVAQMIEENSTHGCWIPPNPGNCWQDTSPPAPGHPRQETSSPEPRYEIHPFHVINLSFQYVSSSFHLHAQCRMHIPLKGSPAPHIPEPLSWRIVCSHGLQVFLADKWLLLQDEALLVWLLLCQIVMAHCLQGSESSWKIYIFTEHLSLNIQKHLKRGYHKNKKMVHMHFQMAFLGPNKPCFSNFPTIY